MPDDVRPGIGQALLLERYVWWQPKAGLAFPSRGCALFAILAAAIVILLLHPNVPRRMLGLFLPYTTVRREENLSA
jgi:hypothetical protein